MKATNAENNCIFKIKIMNKIQHIKTYKNNAVLLYIYLKMPRIKK